MSHSTSPSTSQPISQPTSQPLSQHLSQNWIVLKFGGTSIRSLADWQVIAGLVSTHLEQGYRVLLVVSAVRGVTDAAVGIAGGEPAEPLVADILARYAALTADLSITPELDDLSGRLRELAARQSLQPTEEAELLGLGEYFTSRCGQAYLEQQGINARWVDARDLLTTTPRQGGGRSDFLAALCDPAPDPERAAALAAAAPVWITQGFVARHPEGQPAVLGRGGSDTSAACLAALLKARQLQIWTDVPGLFSSDPRLLPGARLLRHVSYREAQELASMGARVLHPMSVEPARKAGIPLQIRWTARPDLPGTEISTQARDFGAQVKGIVSRQGVTLIALEGFAMWHQVGFLADAFALFKKHGFSIDLISTSEANVTLTLDPSRLFSDEDELKPLVSELETICQVQVIRDCASVSLVGMGIRTILHKLGPALEVFEHRHIHLVSQASNDLNLTFVVDRAHADKLVMQLHQQLIPGSIGGDSVLGPTWEQLHRGESPVSVSPPWWHGQRQQLLELLGRDDARFVYSRSQMAAAAARLTDLKHVDRVLYAIKANPHPELLKVAAGAGLGIECVSLAEVEHALAQVPGLAPEQILFTPNFAPREEYRAGLELGVRVTIDNLFVLTHWGEDFAGHEVFVRLDPGSGLGHHKLVRTAGANSKFGIVESDFDELIRLAARHRVKIVGLHAHVGSGVMHAQAWQRTLKTMNSWLRRFPDVQVLDLGGGLGVPDRHGEPELDLAALDEGLVRPDGVELWLEPGRYLVAEAGVLLARVTQLKGKGEVQYVGVATGMNSLIRPALYGAYHEIFNLTRLDEPPVQISNVVGPICETGDILGLDRLLPASQAGDVLLVARVGAYGAAMASRYNLREPAPEQVID